MGRCHRIRQRIQTNRLPNFQRTGGDGLAVPMRRGISLYLIVGGSIIAAVTMIIAARVVLIKVFDSAEKSPYSVNSTTYNTPSSRLRELQRHWSGIKSQTKDTVYILHIYPSVLGPSVVEYTIGVKVDQKNIDNWLGDCTPSEESATNNMNDFKEISIPWHYSSVPKDYYTSTGDHVIVFRKEGIILIYGQD